MSWAEPTSAAGPLLGGAVVIVIGLVLGVVPSRLQVEVLPIPSQGDVVAHQLSNGTPVFIMRVADDEPVVIEAIAPETSAGSPVAELVAWCGDARRFVAAHHGRSFRDDGRRYVGTVPGRLPASVAPADLVGREVEVIEGRAAAGAPIRVHGPVAQVAVGPPVRPTLGSDRSFSPPQACRTSSRRLHAGQPVEPARGARPLDHADLAGPLDLDVDRWQVVVGSVAIAADGRATWCPGAAAVADVTCRVETLELSLGLDAGDTGGSGARLSGPLALRTQQGRVVAAAVLFGSSWTGSSLGGGRSYRGRLTELSPARSAVDLRPPPADPDPCLIAAPNVPDGQPGLSQFIDADTVLDVPGWPALPRVTAPDGPAGLVLQVPAPGPTTHVEVVVDAVSCRALRIEAAAV